MQPPDPSQPPQQPNQDQPTYQSPVTQPAPPPTAGQTWEPQPSNIPPPANQQWNVTAPLPGQPTSGTAAPAHHGGDKEFIPLFLLSYLVGSLGVDRFYMGKTVSGILKLITFGGLGVWWLIDFTMVCFGKMKDKQGRPVVDYDRHKSWARIVGIVLLIINLFIFLGIIAVFALSATSSVQGQARDTERKADLRGLQSELAKYYALNNKYPQSISDIPGISDEYCSAPDSTATCADPDYKYELTVVSSQPFSCPTTSSCAAGYSLSTPLSGPGAMETIANPYILRSTD